MNDLKYTRKAQVREIPIDAPTPSASNRNSDSVWPAALLILGSIFTFAWIVFLAWFVLHLLF
jgi:hypothetical protein